MRRPDEWKKHMARVEETAAKGIRAYPMCSPNRITQDFTMKNTQMFRGLPTWHPILLPSDEEKLRAYADPGDPREAARGSGRVQQAGPARSASRTTWWNYMLGQTSRCCEKNKWMRGQDHRPARQGAGQGHHRRLPRPRRRGEARHRFLQAENNVDDEAMKQDPDPPERDHRARRRRRARAVPRRLRLLAPGCSASGCARSRS